MIFISDISDIKYGRLAEFMNKSQSVTYHLFIFLVTIFTGKILVTASFIYISWYYHHHINQRSSYHINKGKYDDNTLYMYLLSYMKLKRNEIILTCPIVHLIVNPKSIYGIKF